MFVSCESPDDVSLQPPSAPAHELVSLRQAGRRQERRTRLDCLSSLWRKMGRSGGANSTLSRLLSSLSSALLLVLCCCCCSCDARPAHRSSPRVVSGSCTYSPSMRELGLSWQRRAASFCSAWGGGTGCGGDSWRSRALATATAGGAVVVGGRAREDRVVRGRGVWMKANKKNKRKREQRQANESGSERRWNHALSRVTHTVCYVQQWQD